MSYLLFLDESGHDHKNMPYEIHGGVALHASKLWPFVKALSNLEQAAFGDFLHRYKSEIKGWKLLDKDRLAWAKQDALMDEVSRRKHCLGFLNKGLDKKSPTRPEFTAYGQACVMMARGIFDLLREHEAKIFAAAIPRSVAKPETFEADEYLRKDIVFLLERYFYLLELERETGLIVLDETDKTLDRRFVSRLERYFKLTHMGRNRSVRIVPSPFFVASDMTYPVQVADVCIYAINQGFRLPKSGMDAPVREDIQKEFSQQIGALQFKGDGYKEGAVFVNYGIVYVPDPYEGKREK
jgi:Protein of unknown function (DUF3800)